MIARLRQQPAQTKWLWSLSGICRSYRVAAVGLGREQLSPSVKERIYCPMYLHQYKMLINTGHLLTGDVGNRAQSLAPGWSTVESRLLFQAELFNHLGPALLKQSESQIFFLPYSFFFSFLRKRFWFWQIGSLSQEVSSQTYLKLSTLKHCQFMWKCSVRTPPTAYALRETGHYNSSVGHVRVGFCHLFCVFEQVISGQREHNNKHRIW